MRRTATAPLKRSRTTLRALYSVTSPRSLQAMSSIQLLCQAIANPHRSSTSFVLADHESSSPTNYFDHRTTQRPVQDIHTKPRSNHRPTVSPCHDVGPVAASSSPRPQYRRSSSLSTLINAWEPDSTKAGYEDHTTWFQVEDTIELKKPKLEEPSPYFAGNTRPCGNSASQPTVPSGLPTSPEDSSPKGDEKTRKRRRRNGETPRDESRRKYRWCVRLRRLENAE